MYTRTALAFLTGANIIDIIHFKDIKDLIPCATFPPISANS